MSCGEPVVINTMEEFDTFFYQPSASLELVQDYEYVTVEFDLFDISMVSSGGYPIQESEEDKYDRAMAGI